MTGTPIDFEPWYRREHEVLVRALWSITGDRDVAVDIAAEAFSRALERWDRVGSMDSPGGWTRQVAVNLSRRRQRRAALERTLLRREGQVEVTVDDERDLDLWRAVASLPPREREAVALRYVAGLKESEVGEAMGISEGAASAALTSARRRLKGVVHEVEVLDDVR